MNYRAIIDKGLAFASNNKLQEARVLVAKVDLNILAKEAATDCSLRKKVYDLGVSIARSLIRRKEYDEAADILESLQNKFRIQNDSLLYYYRALSLFGSGRYDEGVALVCSVIADVDDAMAALMMQAAGESGLKNKCYSKAYDIYVQGITRFAGKKDLFDVAFWCYLFASEAGFGLGMNEKSEELLDAVISSSEAPEWAKQTAADLKSGAIGLRHDSNYWVEHGNEESEKIADIAQMESEGSVRVRGVSPPNKKQASKE